METLKIIGILAGILIVIIPTMGFFIRYFFNGIKEDIKEIKGDVKQLNQSFINVESRISFIEGKFERN